MFFLIIGWFLFGRRLKKQKDEGVRNADVTNEIKELYERRLEFWKLRYQQTTIDDDFFFAEGTEISSEDYEDKSEKLDGTFML